MKYSIHYHCHGVLDDMSQSEFGLDGKLYPLEFSFDSVFKLITDEIYSKFTVGILRVDGLTFHLSDEDDTPVTDVLF